MRKARASVHEPERLHFVRSHCVFTIPFESRGGAVLAETGAAYCDGCADEQCSSASGCGHAGFFFFGWRGRLGGAATECTRLLNALGVAFTRQVSARYHVG